MKLKIVYTHLLVLPGLIFYPAHGQNDQDTIYQQTSDSLLSTYITAQEIFIPKGNDPVLDMLDSLVVLNFFTNTSFTVDTCQLNVHHFKAGEVPVWPDSVIEQRLKELGQTMIIDLGFNRYVSNYIQTYSVKKRELTSRILGLSGVYFPMFEEHLDKYNLPLELKYLAVVESALNPVANSRAGAKGLWQFMYSTGKLYGLKVNSLVDDRFDPYKSTDAACRHLRDLYRIYGDWSLALAAYNSGAGNVNKAIRRAGGVKNYWAIWPYLPRETRGYVPAFIAVVYVMNYAADHNLYPVYPGILSEQIDTVTIQEIISFEQISELLGIQIDELRFLNPAYKAGIIPSSKDQKYTLRLPANFVPGFIDREKELYAYKTKNGIEKEKLQQEIKKVEEQNIHIVKSGENLGSIAQKYRVSVKNLQSWNNLKGTLIRPGQKLVVYSPGYTRTSSSSNSSTPGTSPSPNQDGQHIVKSGESLGLIATKYNCSVDDLKKWNHLESNMIRPNQQLIVSKPVEKKPVQPNVSGNTIESGAYVYHTVRKGDTLWDIAKLYNGVTVEQLKELNNITNSNNLKPGQKLKVAPKG